MYERVAVFGDSLAIVGPHYRGGKEFYFADLGVKDASMVTRLELVDFDGDGHDEIVIQKRIGAPDKYREIVTVTKVGADDTPFQAFAHEVGIKTADGKIENRVSFKNNAIEVAQGESEGFDPATLRGSHSERHGLRALALGERRQPHLQMGRQRLRASRTKRPSRPRRGALESRKDQQKNSENARR